MPTTFTHYLHGQCVYHDIANKHYFDPNYMDYFNVGVHGPDIVFYYHFLNPKDKNKVGYDMHLMMGDELFTRFKQIYLQHTEKDKAMAYLCGFICHFALDSSFHPMIYRIQREGKFTHSLIETQLDRTLLTLKGVSDPTKYDLTQHIHPSLPLAQVISPFFESFDANTMLKSLQSQVNVHHLLHCNGIVKRKMFTSVLSIPKNKFFRDLIMIDKDDPRLLPYVNELLPHWESSVSRAVKLIDNYVAFIHNRDSLDPLFHHDFEEK